MPQKRKQLTSKAKLSDEEQPKKRKAWKQHIKDVENSLNSKKRKAWKQHIKDVENSLNSKNPLLHFLENTCGLSMYCIEEGNVFEEEDIVEYKYRGIDFDESFKEITGFLLRKK